MIFVTSFLGFHTFGLTFVMGDLFLCFLTRLLIDLIFSEVYIKAHKWIFNISDIVQLNFSKNELASFFYVCWNHIIFLRIIFSSINLILAFNLPIALDSSIGFKNGHTGHNILLISSLNQHL